jgi:hypothetical protein
MIPPLPSSEAVATVLVGAYASRMEEISRRSTLQWASASGYLVFASGAFHEIIEHADGVSGAWAVSLWPVGMLAYLFAYSQWRQICRARTEIECLGKKYGTLGEPITVRAEVPRSPLFDKGWLLWIVFLVIPIVLTLLAAYRMGVTLPCIAALSISLVMAGLMGCLLADKMMPQP